MERTTGGKGEEGRKWAKEMGRMTFNMMG